MATFQDDTEAFVLANLYGFNPPRKVAPARLQIQNTGKYEPDHTPAAKTRCMVLAHWFDKTNIIVQYKPAELIF